MQQQLQPGQPGYEQWLASLPPQVQAIIMAQNGGNVGSSSGRMVPVNSQVSQTMNRDPRYQAARAALSEGSSTSPVTGAYDGLARVLQGVTGGLMSKKVGKQYMEDEKRSNEAFKSAAQSAWGDPTEKVAATLLNSGQQGGAQGQNGVPGAMIPPGGGAPPVNPIQPSVMGRGQSTPITPSSGRSLAANPFAKYKMTSDFAAHQKRGSSGVDYAMPEGTPIVAPMPFKVIKQWTDRRGGNSARVRFADGTVMGIAHLKELPSTKEGGAGDVIAISGNTGRSTGPHAHVRTWGKDGKEINPVKYLSSMQAPESDVSPVNPQGPNKTFKPFTSTIPDPEMPPIPEMPDAGKATPSYNGRFALALMNTDDPYLQETARELYAKGLDERFKSEQDLEERGFELRKSGWEKALTDAYGARDQQRQAVYQRQRDEVDQNFQVANREDQQAFQVENREDQQQFTAEQNAADRAANERLVTARAEAKGPGYKPLTQGRIKSLSDYAGMYRSLDRLERTFNPSFVGSGFDIVGQATTAAQARLPGWLTGQGAQDRVAWWQEYSSFVNDVRHEKYGAALTQTEKVEFEKEIVTPGMSPTVAQARLKRQAEIVATSLRNHANAAVSAGGGYYDPQEVLDLIDEPTFKSVTERINGMKTDAPPPKTPPPGKSSSGRPSPLRVGGKMYERDEDGNIYEVTQ